MSYQFKDLSVLAYANGFTLWHYTTKDSTALVMADGAFDAAADMLRAGDIIIATVRNDAAEAEAHMLLVTRVVDGTVTMGSMLAPLSELPLAA